MKLIAVTQRTQLIDEYHETRDCLDQRWYDFLLACDIIPCIVPNNLTITKKIIGCAKFSGVLFTGGNTSIQRSKTENFLLDFAIQKKMPVLGVCHGMQTIQQYFGDKLQKVYGHVSEKQEIWISGNRGIVNSYHDYGALNASSDFIVWAKADDGVLKAIRHKQLPIIGIMWHPERFKSFRDDDINLVKNIFYKIGISRTLSDKEYFHAFIK